MFYCTQTRLMIPPFTKFKFRHLATLLFCMATFLYSKAQPLQTRIYGDAPQYSNMGLVFESYQNHLNFEEEELFSLRVDSTGNFSLLFTLEKTTYAFSDLGSYRGFVYLEPGKEYELKLPPFKPVPQPQKLNPFFEPEQISLGIANQDSKALNALIRNFDDAFYYQLDTKAIKLMASKNKRAVAAIIDSLETRFPEDSNEYFARHKKFRYARLEMLTSRNPEKEIIEKYFASHPVFFNLPAYWDTFRDVFRGFGRKTLENNQLAPPLTFEKIVRSIQTDSTFHRTDVAELLALWTIYQSYHEKLLPTRRTLQLFTEGTTRAQTNEIKAIARNIHREIAALQPGSLAPGFTLADFDRKEHKLEDFRGKFVYLNFMHSKNYACQRELRLMPQFYKKFGRDLEIITILIDENFENATSFVNNSNYQWTFLHFGMNANVLNKYNIRAVPQYFLINPEGKLVLSPASAPGENFHDKFVKQYREYQRELERKTPREQRSIFN
jgi:peroxiredoxin